MAQVAESWVQYLVLKKKEEKIPCTDERHLPYRDALVLN
jgi:hypothetical protein